MIRKPKSPRRRAVEQFFVRCIVLVLLAPVRFLPMRAVRGLAQTLAPLVSLISFRRRKMVDENLQAVFGDGLSPGRRREIRMASIINITKTMLELIRLQWMTDEELKREVSVEGLEHLDAGLARGNGVILVTAHFGNWEYAGALLALLGYPMNVIARDAHDSFTRDLINDARRSKGVEVFGRDDARTLIRALRNNEVVAILPDQHAAHSALRLTFLGRAADTASGPATFAIRTGAALLPVFAYRQPDDHIHCRFFPLLEPAWTGDREADTASTMQLINDVMGEQIRAHPEQWLWLHNRWKAEARLKAAEQNGQ